jgi:hypothetical protein
VAFGVFALIGAVNVGHERERPCVRGRGAPAEGKGRADGPKNECAFKEGGRAGLPSLAMPEDFRKMHAMKGRLR